MTCTKAVVLLSGGLDSTTTLAFASKKHSEVVTLGFIYGQRNSEEQKFARLNSSHYGAYRHVELEVPIAEIAQSSLTGYSEVPIDRSESEILSGVPSTYVPARNTIFLALGAALAESEGAEKLYIGVNAVDYSGYPDCRPEFINALNEALQLGTKAPGKVQIATPLINLSKKEIIELGHELGVDFSKTISCYNGAPACGRCDSCKLRLKGFADAGLEDPVEYENLQR